MAKVINRRGKILVEDGFGGWREAGKQDISDADISLPPEMEARIRANMPSAMAPTVDMTDTRAGATPENPIQEMGIPALERLKLKNFASSPDSARKYLEGLGYEVRPYGGGVLKWNFAVRKAAGDPWRVVDPDGGAFTSDIVYDLLDMTTDAVQGFITAGATVAGGGIASAVTGGAAGAGTEVLRQGAGSLMGIPDNMNAGQVATVGAVSGAMGPVGRLIGAAGRGLRSAAGAVGEGVEELAASLAGARPAGTMTARDIFVGRVMDPAKTMEKLPSFAQTVDDVVSAIRKIPRIPELQQADDILAQVKEPIDMTSTLESLADVARQQTAEAARKAVRGGKAAVERADEIVDEAYAFLARSGANDVRKVPAVIAEQLKSDLQDRAEAAGAYAGKELAAPLRESITHAAAQTRLAIEKIADASGIKSPGGKPYSELMAKGAQQVRLLRYFQKVLGSNDARPVAREKAEQYLASIYGSRRSARLAFAREFNEIFGIDLEGLALRPLIGSKIGDEGVPGLIPNLGSGLAARAIAPLVSAGSAGLLSPRGLVGAGKAGVAGYNAVAPAASGLAQGAQAVIRDPKASMALTLALQEAARNASARPGGR